MYSSKEERPTIRLIRDKLAQRKTRFKKNHRDNLILQSRVNPTNERKMIWNCVEDRIDDGSKYGRVSRKIIFGNIYADKTAVLSRNPIPVDAHTHLKVQILRIHYIYST